MDSRVADTKYVVNIPITLEEILYPCSRNEHMNKSGSDNDTQAEKHRRRLLKLTASLGLISITGSSSVAASYHTNGDSSENVDYTPDTGSVSFVTPEEGATKQGAVTFEMTATDFIIEAADNGVTDGAGHLHILVDQDPLSSGEVIPNNESNGYYHYGGGQTKAEIDLDPGDHTVRLQAGDAEHRAYDLTDSINITVKESDKTEPSTSLTMDNVGSSAWEVSSIDSSFVESTGGENPTITLDTGVRYSISNNGWSAHPLAFYSGSETQLLSQDSNEVGTFENDTDVNWVDNGSTLTFTLTDALADELSSYICTVHSSMEGSIETAETVSLSIDELEPKEVPHPNGGKHTLTFSVQNLSADGGEDDLSIALPSDIVVDGVNIAGSGSLDPIPSDPSASNPIEFSVNPSPGDIDSSPVKFELELELSAANN